MRPTSISGVRSSNTNGAPSHGPDATVTGLNHTARIRRENARTRPSNWVESALAVKEEGRAVVVVVCVGGWAERLLCGWDGTGV